MKYWAPQFSKEALESHLCSGKDIALTLDLGPEWIAVEVNGVLQDLICPIPDGATLHFIQKSDPKGLDIIRHTAAHVLAQAVKELYPDTLVTIGPVIENGFYYDFYRKTPFQEDDLRIIQERMHDIVQRNEPIVRQTCSRDDAIARFLAQGETFKVDIIKDIPQEDVISLYTQGAFVDLCRGPHLPSTGSLGSAFCLTKLSGAYWRGDAQNVQLQRIYGTAWATQQELDAYLSFLEEAEKRDHRRLGKEMDLFHFQKEAPGSVFWHPHGWIIYRLLQDYIRKETESRGYQEVNTPQLIHRSLWEASGHWAKFRENMFAVQYEEQPYALKPMSCPCHVQIFNQQTRSYRELPLRLSEFGNCMRCEASGARTGLMRLTSFVQDDGHIFVPQTS